MTLVSGTSAEDFGHQTILRPHQPGWTPGHIPESTEAPPHSTWWQELQTPPGGGGGISPFDPRGAFQIPNNFWGFVMLVMGLKS